MGPSPGNWLAGIHEVFGTNNVLVHLGEKCIILIYGIYVCRYEMIYHWSPDNTRKMLVNIRKTQERLKKKCII